MQFTGQRNGAGLAELGLALLAKEGKNKTEYLAHLKKARELDPANKEIQEEWSKASK